MTYFSSPGNQMQADKLRGRDVLVSFATYRPFLDRWQGSWRSVLIDSGAFSELNSGKSIDLDAYEDFALRWQQRAVAVAGLDDIGGDWRRSLRNYDRLGFPTFHDTDPDELLADLIPIARDRGGWLGIGLRPPRQGRERWLRETLERVPCDLHIHGWALRAYRHLPFDSLDSTNWLLDTRKVMQALPWVTAGEAIELVLKRYDRAGTELEESAEGAQMRLAVGWH